MITSLKISTHSFNDIQIVCALLKCCKCRDGRDGRDGLTGRDGLLGPPGAPGRDGSNETNGQKEDKGEKGDPGIVGLPSGGAVYTRWGKTSSPNISCRNKSRLQWKTW